MRRFSDKGFSLIEILIASFIAVLLMAPLFVLFHQSQQQTQQSFDEIVATHLAREVVDQFHSITFSMGYRYLSPISGPGEKKPWVNLGEELKKSEHLYSDRYHKDARIHAMSRIELSPIPDHFRVLFKFYPANAGSDNIYRPVSDLYHLEVRVEWKSSPTTSEYNRYVKLVTLINYEEILPGL
jgi:prepilin-type N-terminal cleavage/methylation domain-containing protein